MSSLKCVFLRETTLEKCGQIRSQWWDLPLACSRSSAFCSHSCPLNSISSPTLGRRLQTIPGHAGGFGRANRDPPLPWSLSKAASATLALVKSETHCKQSTSIVPDSFRPQGLLGRPKIHLGRPFFFFFLSVTPDATMPKASLRIPKEKHTSYKWQWVPAELYLLSSQPISSCALYQSLTPDFKRK